MPIIGYLDFNSYRIDFVEGTNHHGVVARTIDLRYTSGASTDMNADAIWASFAVSSVFTGSSFYPAFSSVTYFDSVYGRSGTNGSEIITKSTGGNVFAYGGNDTMNLAATNGTSQIHVWAGNGDDIVNMSFANITSAYSHGHHTRGDAGNDTFNLTSIAAVGAGEVVVGRIEDFDATRDNIQINGLTVLGLGGSGNLAGLTGVTAKIVLHNGDLNDPGAAPQQWLVIKSATGGYVLYALEGARIDMDGNGGANNGGQESHFLNSNQVASNAIIALFEAGPGAAFIDPQNYVPASAIAQGGLIINDDANYGDDDLAGVTATILGGINGDLIAAGINNDTVSANAGNDQVWGGSGHDSVNGDDGHDTLFGNLGNDVVNGGNGNDVLNGGMGDDTLSGDLGNDLINGDVGNDTLIYTGGSDTLNGGAGFDTIVFSGATATTISLFHNTNNRGITFTGIENLTGNSGADNMIGNAQNNRLTGNGGNDSIAGYGGNDVLLGGNGDDYLWANAGNDTVDGGAGVDYLEGGEGLDLLTGGLGNDTFRFSGTGLGVDTITDFGAVSGNDDRFLLSAAGFGGGLTTGALSAAQFRVNTTGAAQDADDRFIFNSAIKGLYFDIDGLGGTGPVLLATLQSTAANLTASDFVLN